MGHGDGDRTGSTAQTVARWKLVVVSLWGVGVLGLHAWSFAPFLSDDALISLRYTRNLLRGDGLVWNAGEHVEGYSNLLWVVASAFLGVLGVDLVVSLRVLGVLGMSAAVCAVVFALRRSTSVVPAWFGATALALSAPLAVWAIGGLEQGFIAGFFAWAIALLCGHVKDDTIPKRSWVLPSALLAALTLTRPDGILLAALVGVGFWLARSTRSGRLRWDRESFVSGALLGVFPVFAWVSQLVFRLAYYGDWVPNTAHIKIGPSWNRFSGGFDYILTALSSAAPYFVAVFAGVLGLWVTRRWRPVALFLTFPALIWTAYVIFIGGDIFPGFRHAVALFVLAGFGAAWGVQGWLDAGKERAAVWSAVFFTALCVAPWSVWMQHREHHNARAKTERWEWDGEVVGTLLRDLFLEKDALLAVDPAGTLPYWSELRSVDMLGLNDRTIAQNPPEDLGSGALAHEFGDGAYVLSREPDLVLFCLPHGGPGACFRSGHEMLKTAEFYENYILVSFWGQEPYPFKSRVWVRHTSSKVGVVESHGGKVKEIPVWLWGGAGSVVRDGEGAVFRLDEQKAAQFDALYLERGEWVVDVELRGSSQVNVMTKRGPRPKHSTAKRGMVKVAKGEKKKNTARFQVTRPGRVQIQLRAETKEGGDVVKVTVRRVGGVKKP